MVLVKNVSKLEKLSYYKLKGNKVVSIEEKPAKMISKYAGTAIYFYRGKGIFKALKNVKPVQLTGTKTPEYYPPLVHQWLIDHGYTLRICEVNGYWCDIGERSNLLKANAEILKRMKLLPSEGLVHKTRVKGKFRFGANCNIRESKIIGPVTIGNNVKISNSIIGPFVSISDNCTLERVKLKNSIILENTTLSNISRQIEESIVGSDVSVSGLKSKDKMQLMLAAHSKIKV
jgi:glucose-1-phosphate thymidylyltransferase